MRDLPESLFPFLQTFLSSKDYRNLMNTSNSPWMLHVRRKTILYPLRPYRSTLYLCPIISGQPMTQFYELIQSKVENPQRQVSLQ